MSRVRLLTDEELETYGNIIAPSKERLGFVPNSQRIMAHKPELLAAYNELGKAVMLQTEGSIPGDLKYMIANAASLGSSKRSGSRRRSSSVRHAVHPSVGSNGVPVAATRPSTSS